MTAIVPREIHGDLLALGRAGTWLKLHKAEGLRSSVEIDRNLVQQCGPSVAQTVARLYRQNNVLSLLWVEALGRCLADGPKLFRPTEEQFESMAQVELHIPINDYKQPYPAVIVEIPEGCRRRIALSAEFTEAEVAGVPRYMLLRTGQSASDDTYVMGGQKWPFRNYEITHFFQHRAEFADMEQALMHRLLKPGDDPRENAFCEITARAGFNLMLLLVHYGCRIAGPLNPTAYAKHRAKPKLAHLAAGDCLTIEMNQHIVVRKVERITSEPGEPTGREMPAHWRRGHWRNQAHGPARTLRKMLFVPPVLVRSDRAVGDLSDGSATYDIK